LQGWLSFHIYTGVLVLLIIPMHAGFRFSANVHTLAFVLLAIVVVSGIVGASLYLVVPKRFSQLGAELGYEEADKEIKTIISRMRSLCEEKSAVFVQKCEEEMRRRAPTKHQGWQLIFKGEENSLSTLTQREKLIDYLEQVPEAEREDFRHFAVLATQKEELENRFLSQMRLQNILEAWLYIHLPVSIAMIVTVAIHLIVVFYY
ncbi:MAG: hypothetical protein HY731_08965, partial [Candidatus Tectomicrobia bacterium]|nr:hypothetical protein [Candidatus Tectomicrobia bacterium]